MNWQWFRLNTVKFWQPITDPAEKWWRETHIIAHMVGGVMWDIILRMFTINWPVHTDFSQVWWARLVMVAVIQTTFWEMVQKENWRPELIPGTPKNAGYPWLSAIWDVIFTVAGAGVIELIQLLMNSL